MPRFRGEVEQVRRELIRTHGLTPERARELAPRFARQREALRDRSIKPYSWLGAQALEQS